MANIYIMEKQMKNKLFDEKRIFNIFFFNDVGQGSL